MPKEMTDEQKVEAVAAALGGSDQHPYRIGEKYIIRAVTFHYTGKLKRVTANELILSDAAWIANSGRWTNFLETGKADEVEPYPDGIDVIIGRNTIVDISVWKHALPRNQVPAK